MTTLAATDLEAILQYSLEIRQLADLDAYRMGILPGLRRLVPADAAGYNEVDLDTGEVLFFGDPPDVFFAGVEERFAALMHQHPLVALSTQGDRSAHTISEFLSEAEFHRLELYRDLFRRLGAEDQIAFSLPGELVIGIALNRSSRTFTDRDRSVLDAVSPHLAQAYVHIRDKMVAANYVTALEAALEATGSALIMLDDRQRVVRQGDSAAELLAAHAVAPGLRSGTLPPVLEAWVRQGRTEQPMVIPSARGQLQLRLVRAPSPPGGWLIALHERRMHPPSISALIDAFGLSRRQAEVLRLLCSGRDTDSVARELQITRATVRKHLEQVYARLGVRSMAAAVALALAEPGMAHR